MQNGFIESFNGSFRDELLNENLFTQRWPKAEHQRKDYNDTDPTHRSAIQTPAQARRTLS